MKKGDKMNNIDELVKERKDLLYDMKRILNSSLTTDKEKYWLLSDKMVKIELVNEKIITEMERG